MFRKILALVIVLAWASPAAAQNKREMQMMADIRMLQEQTQQLQQQMTTAITTLTDALKSINGRLDDQTGATRKAFADQKLNVDQVASDLRVIRERVDDTNVRIGSLSQEVEALRLSIPQYPPPQAPVPVEGTAGSAPLPGGTPAPAPAMPTAAAPSAVGPGVSPQRMYDSSWADFTAGQWTSCIQGFELYLRTFPRSEMAADAQFYIAECYLMDGKFAESVDAYNRTVTSYPRSGRVPDAMYKRGIAFERLGQNDRARESYEQVMKNYPDADSARLAKQSLDRLNRGKPPVDQDPS